MEREETLAYLYRRDFGDEAYERHVLENLSSILASAKTFVDIGACLGAYTCAANAHIRGGRIIAIEADPVRFDELRRNCQRWQAGSSNTLLTMHAAVSNTDGPIEFWTTNSPVDGGVFKPDISSVDDRLKRAVRWEKVSVPGLTLDTLFKDGGPDFIKMDVEGSELRILQGSTRILREGRTRFWIEIHDWADPAGQRGGEDVVRFMNSFGYYGATLAGTRVLNRRLAVEEGRLLFTKMPSHEIALTATVHGMKGVIRRCLPPSARRWLRRQLRGVQ